MATGFGQQMEAALLNAVAPLPVADGTQSAQLGLQGLSAEVAARQSPEALGGLLSAAAAAARPKGLDDSLSELLNTVSGAGAALQQAQARGAGLQNSNLVGRLSASVQSDSISRLVESRLKMSEANGTGSRSLQPSRREGDFSPLAKVAEVPEEPPEKPYEEIEKQLEEIKLETMHKMVQPVEYTRNDVMYTGRLLFLTNRQANQIGTSKMQKAIEALDISEPKLIIQLMPSLHSSFSFTEEPVHDCGLNPYVTHSEFGDEAASECEANVTRLALDVLLPLASRTSALIIGSSGCGLLSAFVKVAAPIMQEQGTNCPFSVLCYGDAPTLYLSGGTKGTVANKLRKYSATWKQSDARCKEVLTKVRGADPAFWSHQDLPPGASHFLIFEMITPSLKTDHHPLKLFINNLVSTLSANVPCVALQAFGVEYKLQGLQALSEHVNRGLPLLLLDVRRKAERHLEGSEEITAKLEDDARDVAARLQSISSLGERLHAANEKADFYHCSNLAFLKEAINQRLNVYNDVTTKEMWLHEAIQKAKATTGRGGPSSQKRQTEATQEKQAKLRLDQYASKAAEGFVKLVGREIDWMSTHMKERAESALQSLLQQETWESLEKEWRERYCEVRGYCFFDYNTPCFTEFLEQNASWITLTEEGAHSARGCRELQISGRNSGMDLNVAKQRLKDFIEDDIRDRWAYDASRFSAKVLSMDNMPWLATYHILKAQNVRAVSLDDLEQCEERLLSMANVDRLPRENSLEALVLLRCAWTLRDTFTIAAARYKRLAKLAYFLLLAIGLVVVVIVTVTSVYPLALAGEPLKYTMLGLALASSCVSAWTVFLDPMKKWLQLQGGALTLESEIWKFRTRVGSYRCINLSGPVMRTRLESERLAESQLHSMLEMINENVLQGAGLKHTGFYSSTTATADLFSTTPSPEQETVIEAISPTRRGLRGLLKNLKIPRRDAVGDKGLELNEGQLKHHQYAIEDEKPPEKGADTFHAPATPEQYIQWRLVPVLHFYQKRIPKYVRQRVIIQGLLITSSLASAVLASTGNGQWTAVLTSLASALVAWQEFANTSKKLDRYSSVAASLSRLLVKWQTLPEVEQQNVLQIESLVERTEGIIGSEHSAWASDAQLSSKMLGVQIANQQKDAGSQQQGSGSG